MIDYSRKQGVTRTGKYSGHYNFTQERTPHTKADQQAKERLEAKERAGTLSEEMEPYLAYLRGERKERTKYLSKLRKLINTSDKSITELARYTDVTRESLSGVSRGRRGILSEASAETVYYDIRKKLTS